MKKISIIFCVLLVFYGISVGSSPKKPNYYKQADKMELVQIVDSKDLTAEMLENRNGNLIIERVIGTVNDARIGAGKELKGNGFISYAGVEGISDGDIICSYFIYNPNTNYIDDIVARYDYIID